MNREPDWDLYRTFAAVAREGSLSAAARALGITQPSVARHLDALEAALDTRLFVRTQRGLSPTDQALALRPYAEQLETIAAAMRRISSTSAGEAAGTVRVTASEIIAAEYFPPILARLRAEQPRLLVEVVASNTVDDLLGRVADVAVRVAQPAQQALIARRVGSVTLGFHAAPAYLERCGVPVEAIDLRDHGVIGYDRNMVGMRPILERVPILDPEALALRSDSTLVQLAMMRAGAGIGVTHVAIGRRDPDLVRVLADALSMTSPVWVVMHEDLRGNAACRLVFDTLAAELPALFAERTVPCSHPLPQRRHDAARNRSRQ